MKYLIRFLTITLTIGAALLTIRAMMTPLRYMTVKLVTIAMNPSPTSRPATPRRTIVTITQCLAIGTWHSIHTQSADLFRICSLMENLPKRYSPHH